MATAQAADRGITAEERKVIFGSSLGTVFEWYDFYLYLVMSSIITKQFFSGVDPTTGMIFTLLGFAAGFIVRPFGAIVFGRLGDMIGRKYTFLLTIVIMGASTFLVGILPSYAFMGVASPIILVSLRILQGLALGGEYGGAATYVAEHAPHGKRGAFTSWIQTTATLGLFLALIMIQATRTIVGEDSYNAIGWRFPFLFSIFLLLASVWIRLSMNESPAFARMKAAGKTSKAPLTEAFGQWKNLKIVILALFGLTAGQAVVWYAGQFYAMLFIKSYLKIDDDTANYIMAAGLLIGTPGFVIFGTLSDKIGRKKIIMAGCLLAAVTYFPLFKELTHFANPGLEAAIQNSPVVVTSDPEKCHFLFNPTNTRKFTSSCDVARTVLSAAAVSYNNVDGPAGSSASVKIGEKVIDGFEPEGLPKDEAAAKDKKFRADLSEAIAGAGYPKKADKAQINYVMVVLIIAIMVIYVTMVYGPIAAMLVELFPTRIRYTSMSLPYHIGNGWFGGLLPAFAVAFVTWKGDIYSGLWYPIGFAMMTFIIGCLFVKETKDVDIYAAD